MFTGVVLHSAESLLEIEYAMQILPDLKRAVRLMMYNSVMYLYV